MEPPCQTVHLDHIVIDDRVYQFRNYEFSAILIPNMYKQMDQFAGLGLNSGFRALAMLQYENLLISAAVGILWAPNKICRPFTGLYDSGFFIAELADQLLYIHPFAQCPRPKGTGAFFRCRIAQNH